MWYPTSTHALLLLFVQLLLASYVVGADVSGAIKHNDILPLGITIRPDTTVTLSPGGQKAYIKSDGTFIFHDIEPGTHVLEVLSDKYHFQPVVINLTPDSIHLQPYTPSRLPLPVTPTLPSLPYPIELIPSHRFQFYDDPIGLNLGGMLKNPMVLMMVFTAIMAFGVPKMMASMEIDPEMAKEVAEMREKAMNFQNTDWSEKLAGALSGSSGSTTSASTQVVAPSAKNGGSSSNPNRKKKR